MQLLYPIGLFATAAILVPLLIHLWKVKKGKTLKIGSISFLGTSARQSAKSIRLSDWLLLFLRCLLLILLAFIIAKPHRQDEKGKHRGWILTQRAEFPAVYQQQRIIIDSLLKQGYELHDFTSGFPTMTLVDTVQTDSLPAATGDYFALLRQLNVLLPAKQEVHLFHQKRVQQMGLHLPKLFYRLKEYSIQKKDTLSHWVSTWKGKVFEAESTPAATGYQWKSTPTTEISILVNSDGAHGDHLYLKAALASIADYSGRKMTVMAWNKQKFLQLKPDMVFWLSDLPLDSVLKTSWKKGAQVFSYAPGKVQHRESTIQLNVMQSETEAPVMLKKSIIAVGTGTKVWTDGYGDVVLRLQKKQDLNQYELFTRLNPAWTTLVWDEQFVKALMPVVIGTIDQDMGFGFELHPEDRREVILPTFEIGNGQHAALNPIVPQQSLSHFFWLAALLVFVLERIISMIKNNKTAN